MVKKKKNRQQEPTTQNAGDSTDSNEENQSSVAGGKCCPHVGKAVDFQKVKKALKPGGLVSDCAECLKNSIPKRSEDDSGIGVPGLWLCLRCGHQGCETHALHHTQVPRSDSHALAVNTQLWTLRCYDCDTEIDATCRKKIHESIEFLKRLDCQKPSLKPTMNGKHSGNEEELPMKHPVDTAKKAVEVPSLDDLPRVRGMKNLGNTCFFNAVLQCLAQTPFLLPLLEETREPGTPFRLPGGSNPFSNDEEVLPPLEGKLGRWRDLMELLAVTLQALRSGRAELYDPRPLLDKLAQRCPQFAGSDQHDAHELLRHLLEEVRMDDLKRYQREILVMLGLSTKCDPSAVDEESKMRVKAYGKQVQDLVLYPEHVFRGELTSTLECQDCRHHSTRLETFLDLSLPVSSDKPQPPVMRKKNSVDPFEFSSAKTTDNQPSKHQLKKERKQARKMRKMRKVQHPENGDTVAEAEKENRNSGESGPEHSDADVEDNVDAEVSQVTGHANNGESGYSSEKADGGREDSEGSSPQLGLPLLWDDEDDCVDATNGDSGLTNGDSALASPGSPTSGLKDSSPLPASTQLSPPSPNLSCRPLVRDSPSPPLPPLPAIIALPPPSPVSAGESDERPYSRFGFHEDELCQVVDAISLGDNAGDANGIVSGDDENDNGGRTLSPRYQCGVGECSVLSCLNQFTALELMTGNNKVGCENCTQRFNKGKEGKMVCTNSTKQLLVNSPPAVLILHLKRFQVQMGALRKISRHVPFPLVLDLAPICSSKCRESPTVKPDQTQIMYSLYGVVEHSGTLRSGHYVAFVKVRPQLSDDDPRWSFVGRKREHGQDEGRTAAEGGTAAPPPGRWYYVSDGRVKQVDQELVLRCQAYLLFYERIW